MKADSQLERLRSLITQEEDVKTLHRLVRVNDERALYLIETPFESFPRFVVGLTSMDNDVPLILARCNKQASAEMIFDDARIEHGLPPADD